MCEKLDRQLTWTTEYPNLAKREVGSAGMVYLRARRTNTEVADSGGNDGHQVVHLRHHNHPPTPRRIGQKCHRMTALLTLYYPPNATCVGVESNHLHQVGAVTVAKFVHL